MLHDTLDPKAENPKFLPRGHYKWCLNLPALRKLFVISLFITGLYLLILEQKYKSKSYELCIYILKLKWAGLSLSPADTVKTIPSWMLSVLKIFCPEYMFWTFDWSFFSSDGHLLLNMLRWTGKGFPANYSVSTYVTFQIYSPNLGEDKWRDRFSYCKGQRWNSPVDAGFEVSQFEVQCSDHYMPLHFQTLLHSALQNSNHFRISKCLSSQWH